MRSSLAHRRRRSAVLRWGIRSQLPASSEVVRIRLSSVPRSVMKNPLRRKPSVEPERLDAPIGDHTDTAGAIRRLTQDDERPSREDRRYGETIFTRPPVGLPRILTGRRRSGRR
jgi:hypothetical protein